MPNHASNLAVLRASGHQMDVYLSALVGPVVWSGTISATPAAANAINLSVTGVSGAHTAVRRGMRVVIETAGGAYKGTLSVRFGGTLSSGNLPVREFSRGHVEIEAGDVFNVYGDLQLVDRLVSADETFSPDGEVYSDQNSLVAPIGASGGWCPGFVDEGEIYATIPLTGGAYVVDADSAGTVTYLTTLPSGCSFAPGSADTDAAPTIRAEVGYHLIERTFTDSSNSKTETQYVLVRVHDASDMPYDVPDEITISGERGRGWSISGLRLFGATTLADLPDRAPVVLWCVERIDGITQSFGMKASGRSHVLCTGFLRRDVGKIDGRGDALTVDIISPLMRLGEIPGFSKVMIREASPDGWDEVQALTVKRGILYLLRYYTNAPQLFDLAWDGFDDGDYSRFYLQKQTPVEQARELVDSRDGILNADATGRMEIQQTLELTPLDERDDVEETITLTLDDIIVDPAEGIGVEIVRDHDRPVETFRSKGFTAGEDTTLNTPLFGKWAASPGTGTSSPSVERMIADNAADFFARTARRGAWEDRVYIDGDGAQYHAPEVRVTLPGSYRGIVQFYREFIRLDLDETTNPRGIDLRVFLFVAIAVEVQIARGTARVVLTLRAATYAEGAVDDTPVGEVEPPYVPPTEYPPVVVPPAVNGGSGLGVSTGTLAVFDSTNGKVWITNEFQRIATDDPLFTGYALALTGTLAAFAVRADSLKYVTGSGAVDGYLATTSQVRAIADVFGARTLGAAYSYPDGAMVAAHQVQLQTERGNPGWALVVGYHDVGGVRVYRSTNGGAAWNTESSLPAAYDSNLPNNAGTWMPGLWLHPDGSGLALVSAAAAVTNPPGANFWQTSDYGATWTQVTTSGYAPGDWTCACIVKPISRNDILFHGFIDWTGSSIVSGFRRIIGTTQTDITPTYGGNAYGTGYGSGSSQRAVTVADDDPNAVVLVGYNPSTGRIGVFQTFNALDASPTWNPIIVPDVGVPYRGAYYVNRNTVYLFGVGGALALCKYANGAWSVYDTVISGCGTIVGMCGG